jgi:GAF domain-containing protein
MPCSHSTPEPTSRHIVDGAPVLDAPLRASIDRVSSLVSRLLGASIVTFVLTGDGRYVTASNVGLGDCFSDFPLPLDGSLCEHVVGAGERFVTNADQPEPGAGRHDFGPSYAGTKLTSLDGEVLGAFCALDDRSRTWSASELAILADFAGLVGDHLTFDDTRR